MSSLFRVLNFFNFFRVPALGYDDYIHVYVVIWMFDKADGNESWFID